MDMKAQYDLSKLEARKNPYASRLKNPLTLRLSNDVATDFNAMVEYAAVPYQSRSNPNLRVCLANNWTVQTKWLQTA